MIKAELEALLKARAATEHDASAALADAPERYTMEEINEILKVSKEKI